MSSCQCDLFKAKEHDNALFLSERLSDLTITFPSHNISFPAHRLMMAKTSQYFENLFYGPMAIKVQEWKVSDNDIDPEIFKVMLAHCYSLNILEENVEMILPVYKLADCYLIDSLKSQCLGHVRNIISQDIECSILDYPFILEWSKDYGFIDIKDQVLEVLSFNCNKRNVVDELPLNFSDLLLNLPLETCKELLNLCQNLDQFTFKESWRNPKSPLSSEALMSIIESSVCKYEISILQGCFSPQLVKRFLNEIDIAQLINKFVITERLYLSLIDILHSQAIYECVKDINLGSNDYLLCLHIKCTSMPPKDLAVWSSNSNILVDYLYLSDLDDQHIQWAVETIISINPSNISLPRSSLSINGFKTLFTCLISYQVKLQEIDMSSCNIQGWHNQEELREWAMINDEGCTVNMFNVDDDIYYW